MTRFVNWSFSTGISIYSGVLAGNGQDNNAWPTDPNKEAPKPKSPGDDFKVTDTKGQITYQNKKQDNYATIGSGTIIVGGLVNPDLPGLNRDSSTTQVITQDTYFATPQLNFNYDAWKSVFTGGSSSGSGTDGSSSGTSAKTDDRSTGWLLFNAGCSVLSTNCNPISTIYTPPWAPPKKGDSTSK